MRRLLPNWSLLLLVFVAFAAPARAATSVDLSVSAYTWTPDPVVDGASSTFNIDVTNNDYTTAATGLTLDVALPSNVDFSTAVTSSTLPSGCTLNGAFTQLTCTQASLAPRAVWTTTFQGVGRTTSAVQTTASVTATANTDGNSANDSLTKNTTVIAGTDLAIALTGASGCTSGCSATAGSTYSVSAVVTNHGPDPASLFRATLTLPSTADFTYQGASGSGWSCSLSGVTLTCNYTGAVVASGAAAPTLVVTGRVITSGSSVSFSSQVTNTDGGSSDYQTANNGPVTVVVAVTAGTDLTASASLTSAATGLSTVVAGEAVVLRLQAANSGTQQASGVTLTDTVPADFIIGTPPAGCSVAGQVVTCSPGVLAAGTSSSQYAVPMTVVANPATGAGSTTANVARSAPAGGANNAGTASYTISAPFAHLTMAKSKSPSLQAAGSNFTNTLVVTNATASTSAATGTIAANDVLDANETFVSYSGSGWSCAGLAVGATGTLSCSYAGANLARGSSLPALQVVTRAAPGYLGTVSNTACTGLAASSPHLPADNSTSGNCQTASAYSTPRNVDLSVAVTASIPAPTHVTVTDTSITYTLQVANAGPDVAPTVSVSDPLPAWHSGATGSATLAGAAAGESCSFGSTVSCTLKNLGVGTRTITIVVNRPLLDGSFTNTATVASPDAIDTTPGNNSGQASIIIDPVADVQVTGIATSPGTAKVGVPLTFTTTVYNAGPSTAAGVVLYHTIDTTRVSYVAGSASISGGGGASCSYLSSFAAGPYAGSAGIQCSGFSMGDATTRQLSFQVLPAYPYPGTPPFPGTYASQAAVTTTTYESVTSNNSAASSVQVTIQAVDLAVTVGDPGYDPVAFGDAVIYTVHAQNNGPSLATQFQLSVLPNSPSGGSPQAYSYLFDAAGSTLPGGTSCSQPGGAGTSVICYNGASLSSSTLAASAGLTFLLKFTTGPSPQDVLLSSTTYSASASVTSAESAAGYDSLPGNNSVSETTTVLPKTDLAILSKAVDKPTVSVNEPFNYTIVFANYGPSPAAGVKVTDILPAGVVLNGTPTATTGGGFTLTTNSCAGSGSPVQVDCTLGVVGVASGAGDTANLVTIHIPVKAPYPAYTGPFNTNLTTAATIAPLPNTSLDPVSGNNTSNSVTVQVTKSSIAGVVFNDLNRNGTMDSNATEGVGGVTLTLSGTDLFGNVLSGVTVTTTASPAASQGNFVFDNLPPASASGYTVVETQPASLYDGLETVGTAGGTAPPATCDGSANCAAGAAQNTISSIALAAATAATGYGFQEFGPATVSGYVYSDLNNNGLRASSGEPGIAGVGITVAGTDYRGVAVSQTATTDSSGAYSLALAPTAAAGSFTITENTQPAGYYDGSEQNGAGVVVAASAGRTAPEGFTAGPLNPGTSYPERNFGELASASFTGYVFIDSNGNAQRDAGETVGITGVGITLSGTDYLGRNVCTAYPSQVPSCTFSSGVNGAWSIANLPPGTYTLTETVPAGLTHTGAQAGSAGGTGGSGATATTISGITLGAGVTATGYNFGESGQILTGSVFVDGNGNGQRDTGERGVPGVTITLSGQTANGTDVCTAISPNPCSVTTLADGSFLFPSIPASDAAGYTLTEQSHSAAPLTSYGDGPEAVGTVGGAQRGTATGGHISGIVIGVGQSGMNYTFAELAGSLAGTVFVDANDDGVIGAGETRIPGVTITLSGRTTANVDVCTLLASCTTQSDASGAFRFDAVPGGSYTLTETQPAAYADGREVAGTPAGTVNNTAFGSTAATNMIQSIPLPVNGTGSGYGFGERAGGLAGTVYDDRNANGVHDAGDAGIGGVTVTLTGTDALGRTVALTTVSAASGLYSFPEVPGAGAAGYTLTETQPATFLDGRTAQGLVNGVTCAACNNSVANRVSAIPLQPGSTFTGFDFGEVAAASLSGHVYEDHNGNGVRDAGEGRSGVTLTLSGNDDLGVAVSVTVITGADGVYSFTGLRPSSAAGYTVTETQPAGIADLPGATGSLVGSSGGTAALNAISAVVLGSGVAATGYDFRDQAASLAGVVFVDANNNGVRDAGEVGIAGVALALNCPDAACQTTTAADGSFRFVGLAAGVYTITETHPVIYQDGRETAGTLGGSVDNTAFDTTPVHNSIANISVVAGATGTGYLFAERPGLAGSISGKVWFNSQLSDTTQQPGEPGLAGWIVQLVQNGALVASTTTDANGAYTLSGVASGTGYELRFRNPANQALYGTPVTAEPGATVQGGVIQNLTVSSGATVVAQNLPVDPSGVVYNSVTRNPLAGARVTLTGPSGFDATLHLAGGASNLSQVTGDNGFYQYLLLPGAPAGTYTLSVNGPAGYLPGTSVLLPPMAGSLDPGPGPAPRVVQAQPTPPTGTQSTTYYLSLLGGAGRAGVVDNHIPVDPILAGAIVMTDTTPLVNVKRGDLVPYTLTATNQIAATLVNINVLDLLPPGFRYILRSATVDGVAMEPTVQGRNLVWPNFRFAPNQRITFRFILAVGTGVGEGEYTDSTWAVNNIVGATVSNTASAVVRVIPDPTFDCSDLIGKVFDDRNGNGYADDGEPGIADVRLATPRGLLVTTDAEGRYHIACADIPQADHGSNFVLKLDARTLPDGYQLTTPNPGDVRLTRGKLAKLNFGAAAVRTLRLDLADAAFGPDGQLDPKWDARLPALAAELADAPSMLRIVHASGNGGDEVLRRRLDAVAARVQALWKQKMTDKGQEPLRPLVIRIEWSGAK